MYVCMYNTNSVWREGETRIETEITLIVLRNKTLITKTTTTVAEVTGAKNFLCCLIAVATTKQKNELLKRQTGKGKTNEHKFYFETSVKCITDSQTGLPNAPD